MLLRTSHLVEKGYRFEVGLLINPFSIKVLKKMGIQIWK